MIPALCCLCGTVREVSRQAVRIQDGTRKLKCETCGVMTTHAAVFGGEDWCERRRGPPDVVAELGVQVVHVDADLPQPVIYIPDKAVVFVSTTAEPEERDDWIAGLLRVVIGKR